MALYEVWHVTRRGVVSSTETLGRVRAPHQPAAMLAAYAKWPKHDQKKLTVRPLKWLNKVRRGD